MRGASVLRCGRSLAVGLLASSLLLVGTVSARALPPHWAYELISPADTLGTDVTTMATSSDGDHAWIFAQVPISPEQQTGNVTWFAARRTAAGWASHDLSPRGSDRAALEARSADGETAVISKCDNLLLGCLDGRFSFERVERDGSRSELFSMLYHNPDLEPRVRGVSDDLSRIVFLTFDGNNLLAQDTHGAGAGLYELQDGSLKFIGVDERGDALPCGAELGHSGLGNGFEQPGISADGKTIVYESPDGDSGCPDPVDVYVRRDDAVADISRPIGGGSDLGARFDGASRDGTIVYFETENQVTSADTDTDRDIYRYDSLSGQTSLITGGVGVFPELASVSPAGDYVYFVSTKSVAGHGTDGEFNLYVYHDGHVRFVAEGPFGSILLGGATRSGAPAHITPDGRALLFTSDAPLRPGQVTGGVRQIFQYESDQDQLSCVSCPPDGVAPAQTPLSAFPPPIANQDVRHQSDDGDAVAFETTQALVSSDVNGALDVYLWRRNQPLTLVSTGQSTVDSVFQGMSADGRSVFFLSADLLVPGVGQDNLKAYVARQGGGFAPNVPTPPCADDACQGMPATLAPPLASITETVSKPDVRRGITRVTVGKLTRALRERAAKTGRVPVTFRANGAGSVAVGLAARLGGRWVRADHASRRLSHGGRVSVTLQLSARTRKYLETNRAMGVRVTIRHGRIVARSSVLLRT